jgi:hypothetical protein
VLLPPLKNNDPVSSLFVIASPLGRSNTHTLVIASHKVTWQSSQDRLVGCPVDAAKCLRVRWIAASTHLGLLAMTKSEVVGGVVRVDV